MKDYHEFYNAVYKRDNPETEAGGWIQWKGTNVCMDVYCVCGAQDHIDADFLYYYRCDVCGRVFAVGQNIKLIELTPEEAAFENVVEKVGKWDDTPYLPTMN